MASWREQLAFAPLDTIERGEEIGRRLRHAIELGLLEDGSQLPSENELAARMRVSTLTLRAALAELRGLGLIETRRGKAGGSFVRMGNGDVIRGQRDTLANFTVEELCDIREYRAFLAGAAAAAAAKRFHRIPVSRLGAMAGRIQSADRPADMIRADSRFHIELAATSGSVRLTRQEMAMQVEVGPLVWAGSPDRRAGAAEEHSAIVEAIGAGEPARARELAEDHVRRDMDLLIERRMAMAAPLGVETDVDSAISAIEGLAAQVRRTAVASIRTVEAAVQSELARDAGIKPDELTKVYDVARRTLLRSSPEFFGTGFIGDPSFFGSQGYVWCYTPSDPDSPEPMSADVDFYDLSTAPWWPQDSAGDEVQTSVAFLDASATDEHLITFSKRVVVDGRMAGVAAADILVRQLQASFDPFLRALPENSCIVDQKGGVIATNTASLLDGTYSPAHHSGRTVVLPEVPWQLCVG